jgi:hypothetical protein
MITRIIFAGLMAVSATAVSLIASDSPEELVAAFFSALKENDLFGASAMLHRESLEKLKTEWNGRVLETIDDPKIASRLQPYTHGDPKEAISRYSDRVVFERFLEYLFVSNSKMKEVMQRSKVNVLDSKTMAGTTIVNVEYVTGEVPKTISRKDSVRVRKDGLEYKVLLSRELERTLDLMLNPPVK